MTCKRCDGGYIMCDSNSNDPCELALRQGRKQTHTIERAGQYDVWCGPGCHIAILPRGNGSSESADEPTSEASRPWYLTGHIHLDAGDYTSECERGPDRCRVRIDEA